MPRIGDGLIIKTRDELPNDDAIAAKYIRPYLGSNEVINGLERWCIWAPNGLDPGDRKSSSFLDERLTRVKRDREASTVEAARALAAQPTRFFFNGQPTTNYIGIPAQVSVSRRWYTVAYFTPDHIASNTLYTAEDPSGFLFSILSSSMFMAWVVGVGGSLKSDLRYSKSIVHNTFPLPDDISTSDRSAVIAAGHALLTVRARYPGASLADLYDPVAPPHDLIAAHTTIDSAVDRIFKRRKRKWTDDERLSHLLLRYQAMAATLAAC